MRSLQAAERALHSLGLVSRLPITASEVFRFRDEYVRNRNLIAWNFYNPKDLSEQLDIVITADLKGKDETTICKFRHRLEAHALGKQILATVNQWHFAGKAHIGVDSRTKMIHSVAASAANVHDSHALPVLLHGKETCVWGDSAYQGQTDVIHQCAPRARDCRPVLARCARKQKPAEAGSLVQSVGSG